MSAQLKAKELYNKFYLLYSHPNSVSIRHQLAIQSCLIVCDEVLGHMGADRGYEFWSEVKKEIEKL